MTKEANEEIFGARPTMLSQLVETNETRKHSPYDAQVTAKHRKQEEKRIEDRFRSFKTGGFSRDDSL